MEIMVSSTDAPAIHCNIVAELQRHRCPFAAELLARLQRAGIIGSKSVRGVALEARR